LWEQDFTETIAFLRELQSSAAGDIREYLTIHPDAVATALGKVKVLAVNRGCLEMFQAASAGDLTEALPRTLGPGALDVFRDELAAFLEGRTSFEAETVRLTVTGRPMNISLRSSVLPGHEGWSQVVDSMVDVTAAREAEQKLQELLRQQGVLLKEIHHRVKNNLAVIGSLFYLESSYSKDEHTVRVFEDSQRRVRSMALVHETLYGSQDLAALDFAEYARTLTDELLATYGSPEHVRVTTDLHPAMMALEVAVPCGLILNELVSNAFKHAFPNGRRGTIRVEVRAPRQGLVALTVADDGVGLPPDFDLDTEHSLGMRLIRSLVRQVRGSLVWAGGPGAEARLTLGIEEDHVQ
jgi:two-component sensor histidine kinase